MADPPRRTTSSAIPPPPPPPPNKASSYFSRFLSQPLTTAYGSRPPSAQTHRPDGGRPNPLVPKLPGIRNGSSQDVSHKTGLDISALDVNRERTHAILAGKEILKTVRVQGPAVVEDANLRAAVLNYAEHNTSYARQREGLGIQDVRWSHGQYSTHIATAVANGKVILYDLNRAGVELARLHEHTRQVHKLAFNPHQGHLLLSASHDTTVRLWDLRDMRKDMMTCRSRDQYAGLSAGIRDVQWSPTDAVEFAFGTDNGTLQRWDFRHNKGPKQKVTAHDQRACMSIDWHPDGRHLLSAGNDRAVKVWDFSADGRRQKPAFVLTTPYPVYNARWRPPYWSDEYYEKGAYQCTQLATSYDRDHSVVHVWDFRRPYLPFREINRFASAPSDMLWHSRDTLWTVGREGVFQQNDVHLAPKTVDRRNLQALAVSPSGEMGGFAQKRPSRSRRSASLVYSEDTYVGDLRDKRSSPEKSSLRSSADDSLDDSFLSSSLKRHHGRTSSNRSARSFATTPPSDTAAKVIFLTDSVAMHNEASRPNQIAFRGSLPGAFNAQVFAYLAQKYKVIPLPDPPSQAAFLDVQQVFDQNAEYAQRAAFYRLAETWRIVGASIAVATRRRAALHRERRQLPHKATTLAPSDVEPNVLSEQVKAHDTIFTPRNPAVRALKAANDKAESTSNLATPLARPLTSPSSLAANTQKPHLPDPENDEELNLPPAATGPHSQSPGVPSSVEKANELLASSRPAFHTPHWYHSVDGLRVGSWRATPRTPLTLEPTTNTQSINIQVPPRLGRHGSDESFAMFSASTDSQHGHSTPSSFASGNGSSQRMESLPEERQGGLVKSSFGRPRQELNETQDPRNDGLGKSAPISPLSVPIITGNHNGISASASSDPDGQAGSARSGTGHPAEYGSTERAFHDIEILRRNNQLMRHDSSESEAYTSSMGEDAASSLGHSVDMEASGTIVPEVQDDLLSPQGQRPPPTLPHATESAPPVLDPAAENLLLLSDFQAMHVDAEEGAAFAVIDLLKHILAFLTGTHSDAQTASSLILLLAPLLPQTHSPSDPSEIDANNDTVAAFADTLTALGLLPTQVRAIVSTQLAQLLATGINPFQAEAILLTYHAQLHSLSLFNPAASLRRLAYPTYPAVYEQALKGTQLSVMCLSCKSPINNPKDKMRCESCRRSQAPCPVCWGRYPAFEAVTSRKRARARSRTNYNAEHSRKHPSLTSNQTQEDSDWNSKQSPTVPVKTCTPKATLWTWCPLCGHGGHNNCLSTWFANGALSEGACATEGCLCDCVQGRRRDSKVEETLRKKAEKERSRTVRRGDDWKVSESRAVSAVRNSLGEGAAPAPARSRDANQTAPVLTGPGIPPSLSGGGGAARKEEGKRVRVVVPHSDDQPQHQQQQQQPTTPSQSQFSSGAHGSTFGKLPKS